MITSVSLTELTRNQLADENLGLGDATWTYISGMEEELDPKTFIKLYAVFMWPLYRKCFKKFLLEIQFSKIWESLIQIKFVVMISLQ